MTESTPRHRDGAGPVENSIRMHITAGATLATPTGRAMFIVHELNRDGMVLLLGPKRTATSLSWESLEGIAGYLRGRDWLRIGANRDVNGNPGTLDGYLKTCIKRQVADYVAVVLEHAHLVELNRDRAANVRLMQ